MKNQNIVGKNKSRNRLIRISQFSLSILFIAFVVWFASQVDVEQIRSTVKTFGAWGFLAVGILRLTSVIVPALPGTAYSILAGSLFGFVQGLIIICVADLISCSISFALSRRYGRSFITGLVGDRLMNQIDRFNKQKLESNFFLMTGFLMTGLFDFVSYGIGLTKTPWRKFAPALVISIALSNPPIVALGAGLLESGKLMLGFALLGVFALSLITALLQQKQKI